MVEASSDFKDAFNLMNGCFGERWNCLRAYEEFIKRVSKENTRNQWEINHIKFCIHFWQMSLQVNLAQSAGTFSIQLLAPKCQNWKRIKPRCNTVNGEREERESTALKRNWNREEKIRKARAKDPEHKTKSKQQSGKERSQAKNKKVKTKGEKTEEDRGQKNLKKGDPCR